MSRQQLKRLHHSGAESHSPPAELKSFRVCMQDRISLLELEAAVFVVLQLKLLLEMLHGSHGKYNSLGEVFTY